MWACSMEELVQLAVSSIHEYRYSFSLMSLQILLIGQIIVNKLFLKCNYATIY